MVGSPGTKCWISYPHVKSKCQFAFAAQRKVASGNLISLPAAARSSAGVCGVPFHPLGTGEDPLRKGPVQRNGLRQTTARWQPVADSQVHPINPATYPTHGPGPDLNVIPRSGCSLETLIILSSPCVTASAFSFPVVVLRNIDPESPVQRNGLRQTTAR